MANTAKQIKIGGYKLTMPPYKLDTSGVPYYVTFPQVVLFIAKRQNGVISILHAINGVDKNGNVWGYDPNSGKYKIGTETLDWPTIFDNKYMFGWIKQENGNYYYEGASLDINTLGGNWSFFMNGENETGSFPYEQGYTCQTNIITDTRTIQYYVKGDYYPGGNTVNDTIKNIINGLSPVIPDPDPNSDHGNSEPGGGKGIRPEPPGKFQPGGDVIPANIVEKDAVNSGFITIFTPTAAQIQSLASYLWNETGSNLDKLRKLVADPMDVIMGLHILPVALTHAGSKEIMPGGLGSGVSANYTNKQFVTKDMGSVTVQEYWGSCWDFAPYSRVSCFLPFIGMRTLDTDLVMGKTLHLYYTIEVTTGALLAQIEVAGNVLYEFSGNCALQIPVTGDDYRAGYQSMLTLAATIGAGIASGGTAAPAIAAAGEVGASAASAGITAATVASVATATAGAVMNSKPAIERTGSLGGAAGYMGVQKPYIMIEYPEQCLPKDYMKFNGYPCYETFTLSELSGYTQCETVRFKSNKATDTEQQEIVQFLQAGVVLGGTAPTKPAALGDGIGCTGYTCGSEELVVNKSLTVAMSTQTCHLKKDTDILRPTIVLSIDTPNFNYVYLDTFDRFYYVTGARSIGNNRWEIDLRVDSLTSFTDDISAARCVVSRQENEWNLYLDDGTFKAYQYLNIYNYDFPNGFTDTSYVLLVAGS